MEYIFSDIRVLAAIGFAVGVFLTWAAFHLKRNLRFRRAIENTRQLTHQQRQIMRQSRELLFGVHLPSGRFDYLSLSCLNLTGYTEQELSDIGLHGLLERIHPDDMASLKEMMERIRHQRPGNEWSGLIEYRFLHRDGQYRHMNDYVYLHFNRDGDLTYASGSARDLSRVARLEESLHALEKRFHDSQKLAGLGLLASSVAHDFNNLMTVVVGNVELALLEHGGQDGSVLDEIKKASLRAAELADQMLVYIGKTSVARTRINLAQIVQEMGSLLDVSISKKVRIEYCLDNDTQPVLGDISQIRQVIMNLITNASEAIGDRDGVIVISIRTVDLRKGELKDTVPEGGLPAGTYVRMEISDTGMGMDEETRKKIFDPMYTTKLTGRGLGLLSLLNVVERHHGAVTVESEKGQGSVFRVYFPACITEGAAEPHPTLNDESSWHGYGTVLVADDEDSIREIATGLLSKAGFSVISAKNGLEAVDLFAEHADELTLLLVDLNMPQLNGIEAVLRIRHINPKVPVLFMSGFARKQVMERFENQPHTGFLKKPFLGNELLSAIRSIMQAEDPGD